MKVNKHKVWVHFFIVLALVALLVGGCGRNGISEPDDSAVPPEIPPLSSFVMDFGDFTSSNSISSAPSDAGQGWQQVSFTQPGSLPSASSYALDEQKNWGFAALNVGLWSVLLVVGLVIPVAAFAESFNHAPEQQPDYTWIWSYDVTVNEDVYTAELHGRFIEYGVRWDMYVTKEGEYTDFHWYYGESNLPATGGFWVLKKDPSDPTDLLRIDWQRDLADGTHDIKYTNIVAGGPENGGYIFYGVATEKPYDRFYEIYNKGKDNHTYIEWCSTTQEGRVKNSRHFGDSKWHCWDSEHRDIECP